MTLKNLKNVKKINMRSAMFHTRNVMFNGEFFFPRLPLLHILYQKSIFPSDEKTRTHALIDSAF